MIEHVREHGLNYLGFGGASGSGLWALSDPQRPWVPLACAAIAIAPALIDRAVRVYLGHLAGRRSKLLADNVRLRLENERLRLLLAPLSDGE